MSRNTRQKEAILRVLRKTADHPGAQWIHAEVRRTLPHISLGTVYRDLKALTEEGVISELATGRGSRFDGRADEHCHFHCQRCGTIINLDETSSMELDRNIADKYHLAVSYHQLDFYGLCHACDKPGSTPANTRRGEQGG